MDVEIPTVNRKVAIHVSVNPERNYEFKRKIDGVYGKVEVVSDPERYGKQLDCMWGYRIEDSELPFLWDWRVTDKGLVLATEHFLSPDELFDDIKKDLLNCERISLLYWILTKDRTIAQLMSSADFSYLREALDRIKNRHLENTRSRINGSLVRAG